MTVTSSRPNAEPATSSVRERGLSVIVPVYRSELILPELVQRLSEALPTMADISVPNSPAFSARDYATSAATSPASHTNPPADIGRSFLSSDSSYLAARIRQRRTELRATESLSAFQKQTPGELSAEITELSDPYLQSLIQLYNERGRM